MKSYIFECIVSMPSFCNAVPIMLPSQSSTEVAIVELSRPLHGTCPQVRYL